ncbi:MAG: response regulator [Candidatus Aminicenantes bacterium]|nr:response regulator [Candidatus Aminicenantes bacterium]NIM78246.1 response regulator [Candidatus Aminicenantes bacterium]NIN23752.1 response regulator [Candidatus Aminicenantes bacterium]NIN47459.1 response regulator [Candidatus Aminicenantes bacterium]NIN90387.1 response regulator [Candidatus Aminicenantes bacterium]
MGRDLFPPLPVLLVDDDKAALNNYRILLRSEGINHVTLCQDSREVLPLLSKNKFETILMDLRMPHISGEELLSKITEDFPGIPIIIITGVDDTETVVHCMKMGASDFITKPVDRNRLIASVRSIIKLKKAEREITTLKSRFLSATLNHPEAFSDFDTQDGTMKTIFRYMEVIAGSLEPVLITGESGSGKELAAKAIARLSPKGGNFVSVNVAGLDDQLFTDTLFGHLRGAFTDAYQVRKGFVEQAAGGILFLDEIGDLSMQSQVKLLRLLQEHEYYPIGADVPRYSDARIIVSTNKDLKEMQEKGIFRKDLYYRLCVYHIHVPPLRERPKDIPLLVGRFLEEAAKDLGKKKPTAPQELYTLLSTYRFPGNIRELRAMVYDAVSWHTSKKMSLDTFRKAIDSSRTLEKETSRAVPGSQDNVIESESAIKFPANLPTLKEAQESLIREAMRRAKDNQSIAAQLLGITRQALNKRLRDMAKNS